MLAPFSNREFSYKFAQSLLIIILITLLVFIILNQANPVTTKMGRDSGNFAYVSSYLLKGEILYKYAWENKGPVLFFINAIGLWIGKGTRWGIWGIEFILLLGSALIGFHTLRKQFGIGPASIASLTWLLGLSLVLSGGNFSEEYSLFFSFAALFFFVFNLNRTQANWIDLCFGISLGVNFMIRPNNTGVQLAIILTRLILALSQKNLYSQIRFFIMTSLGFFMPVVLICGYFISQNSLQLFLEASFVYNLFYSNGHLDMAGTFLFGIQSLGFAAGISLIGITSAANDLRHQIKNKNIDPLVLWICIDFFLEVIFSGLSGRNYEHYFICWLPLIAVTTAYLIQKISPDFIEWSHRRSIPFLAALITAIVFTQFNTLRVYQQSFSLLQKDRTYLQKTDLIAEYVNNNTQPNETVLVWGGQYGINFLANRDAPSPYLLYPLYVPSSYTDKITLEYYQAVTSNPPALIVDGSYYLPEELIPLSTKNSQKWVSEHKAYNTPYMDEFLIFFRNNYSYETTIGGVEIYLLQK